jgi:hypothetical protein
MTLLVADATAFLWPAAFFLFIFAAAILLDLWLLPTLWR